MMELHFEPIDASDPARVIIVQAMEAEGMIPVPTRPPPPGALRTESPSHTRAMSWRES